VIVRFTGFDFPQLLAKSFYWLRKDLAFAIRIVQCDGVSFQQERK